MISFSELPPSRKEKAVSQLSSPSIDTWLAYKHATGGRETHLSSRVPAGLSMGWQLPVCEHRFLNSKPTREGNARLFSNLSWRAVWLKRCTRGIRWKQKGKEEEV